jgi:hypothetical protein
MTLEIKGFIPTPMTCWQSVVFLEGMNQVVGNIDDLIRDLAVRAKFIQGWMKVGKPRYFEIFFAFRRRDFLYGK